MDPLASPLEKETLQALAQKYPQFKGTLPKEAGFWCEADVLKFLESGGDVKPKDASQKGGPTCQLLSRARLQMAEEKIRDVPAEYRSFCRRLRVSKEDWRLEEVAACLEVSRSPSAPSHCRSPVLIEKPKLWAARLWNSDFWRRTCGDEVWGCRLGSPPQEEVEPESPESLVVEATVAEYIEFLRLLQRTDRKCDESKALAYPRLSLSGWLPFCGSMRSLLIDNWRSLTPPGLKDHTARWLRLFASQLGLDFDEVLARYYSVSIQATGCIDRLHVEPCGAHLWINQIEGRRLFYLFAPSEAEHLHAGHSLQSSPIDIFSPNEKRYPLFKEAKAHCVILYLGQTLLIPSNWWWYSVALEPSVSLSHSFWNMENKVYFADSLRQNFNFRSQGSRAFLEGLARKLESVREQVIQDDDSDMEE